MPFFLGQNKLPAGVCLECSVRANLVQENAGMHSNSKKKDGINICVQTTNDFLGWTLTQVHKGSYLSIWPLQVQVVAILMSLAKK